MDDMPPRRSRRPQNGRSGGSTFPLIPFLIGVVVLGFVIGAGISMMGRHGASGGDVASDIASAAPTQSPTFAPATLAPLATPRAIASAAVANVAPTRTPGTIASHSPAPSPRATITPTVAPRTSPEAATAKPSSRPVATAIASAAAVARTQPTLLAAPVTPVPLHSHAAVTKSAAPSAAASAESSATAVPATTVDADTDFGRLSASVVRQYLRALGRGDTDSAYGAFGVSPGSGGVAFPEQSAMQASGQILSITARGNNDTQYVTVDIGTPSGTYYATYGVHRSATGAAVIVTHSISKQ